MAKKLHGTWKQCKVSDISQIIRGVSYSKSDAKSTKGKNDFLILRGGNIQDGHIVMNSDEVFVDGKHVSEQQKILKGDVIIVGSTGSEKLIGKAAVAFENLEGISFGAFLMLIRPNEKINKKFFDYYFLSDAYRETIRSLAGGVNINNIRKEYIENLEFPLPPLEDQKRIVQKLDKIFTHLEKIKRRLDQIPELLKQFRQSVLTQAVTGKLVNDSSTWKSNKIENLTIKVGSGSTPNGGQASYSDSGIPLVRSMNIHFSGIKHDGLAFLNDKQAYELRNVEIQLNDVLLNITGASIGRVCLADETVVGGRVNQHVSIVRTNEELLPQYLNIYLSSPKIQNFILSENYGVTRQALTKGQLLNLEITYPNIKLQTKIIKTVNDLFSKAYLIETRYKKLKEQLDQLQPALLAKAFRGEMD